MESLEHNSNEHDTTCGNGNGYSSTSGFEFPKGGGVGDRAFHHRPVLGTLSKSAPSKWDDAQKWLVSLSSGGGDQKNKPKPSHAPRKISFPSLHGKNSSSKPSEALYTSSSTPVTLDDEVGVNVDEGETKKIDYDKWNDKPMADPGSEVPISDIPPMRSICMRDMGTEMTPIASQEPSRTATPIRATTPSIRSPVSSGPSTPGRSVPTIGTAENYQSGLTDLHELTDKERQDKTRREIMALGAQLGKSNILAWASKEEEEQDASKSLKTNDMEQVKMNALDARAAAWEEAEQAKYLARHKREEVKIQAWESNPKRKAEAEMRKIGLKAERMKSGAHERLMKKLEKVQRTAQEKHATAEAKVTEQAIKTAQRADFIRQTGHLPSSSFSCKFLSCKLSILCRDRYHR